MSYTRKDAESCLEQLAWALGRDVGYEPGCWWLDYNSHYGGYVVVEGVAGGGERHPLGSRRRSAREFCSAVSFALSALCEREPVEA